MKPSQIFDILDLTVRARNKGFKFAPLFVGPPGVGKSEIVQEWCKDNDYKFVDIRTAYYEAPDMIGFPQPGIVNGREVTKHYIPDFWPHEGKGIILLDEVNRGTTSVMNTLMQLLTDRKVKDYSLPTDWIIVGCINPETEQYDVNTMDPALKDRFEIFQVDYSREDFVNFMETRQWDQSIINFVETNSWTFVKPEDVSKNEGSKYISPRTFSKLNAALKSDIPKTKDDALERMVMDSILGRIVGNAFYFFKHNAQPVLFRDLNNPKTYHDAIQKIKLFSDPNNYKAGTLAVTVKDIVTDGTIEDALLANVVLALPADLGPQLIKDLEFNRKDKAGTILKRLLGDFPKVQEYLKNVLKQ